MIWNIYPQKYLGVAILLALCCNWSVVWWQVTTCMAFILFMFLCSLSSHYNMPDIGYNKNFIFPWEAKWAKLLYVLWIPCSIQQDAAAVHALHTYSTGIFSGTVHHHHLKWPTIPVMSFPGVVCSWLRHGVTVQRIAHWKQMDAKITLHGNNYTLFRWSITPRDAVHFVISTSSVPCESWKSIWNS